MEYKKEVTKCVRKLIMKQFHTIENKEEKEEGKQKKFEGKRIKRN